MNSETKMKISNDASVQIRNIKAAIDDAYVKLDVKLYKKNDAVRVSYSEVNVFEIVSENFEYISKIIRDLQESERVSD